MPGLLDGFPSSSNLNAQGEEQLLVTGKVYSNNYRFLGKVRVKGKDEAVKIFDFYGGDVDRTYQLKNKTRVAFEEALQYYYNRKFGKAADLFKEIAQAFPEDVATEYYMEKSIQFVIDGVDAEWNGVEEMMIK